MLTVILLLLLDAFLFFCAVFLLAFGRLAAQRADELRVEECDLIQECESLPPRRPGRRRLRAVPSGEIARVGA